MPIIHISSATTAPPIILQADRVRRRITASDSVAALVAELAFGPSRRDHGSMLAGITAERVGASVTGGR